jgi:Cft2 family RNA processing exonuclease
MNRDIFLPIGGGNEIGASSYLLLLDGMKILIDAGIRLHSNKSFPDWQLINQHVGGFKELDAFLLTHAHLDHCGAVAKIYYEAPRLPKYASIPTIKLMSVMLQDALNINTRKSEDWTVKDSSNKILSDTIRSFNQISFNSPFYLDASDILIHPIQAGHILGATSYLLETRKKRILITGDVCLHNQRTISGLDLDKISDIDVLIIESTYAYQPEYRCNTYEEEQFDIVRKINEVVLKGGRVLIPSFALGRAQEIACLLGDYFEQGILAPFPVLIDGLIKPICDVYNEMKDFLQGRQKTRPDHSIYTDFIQPTPDGYSPTRSTVQQLPPGCIICSSGMLLDYTRSAKYAEHLLENSRDAIFFSGYQDDESPGSRLLALNEQPAQYTINHHTILPKAKVDRYHLSAHAPSIDLQKIILTVKPTKVILMHGNYRYKGDPHFIKFLLQLEADGIHVDQSSNGVPIYL